jgi:hypothetical protein
MKQTSSIIVEIMPLETSPMKEERPERIVVETFAVDEDSLPRLEVLHV